MDTAKVRVDSQMFDELAAMAGAQFDDFTFRPEGMADVRREIVDDATEAATKAEYDAVTALMDRIGGGLTGEELEEAMRDLDDAVNNLILATMHAAADIGVDVARIIPASKADAMRRLAALKAEPQTLRAYIRQNGIA